MSLLSVWDFSKQFSVILWPFRISAFLLRKNSAFSYIFTKSISRFSLVEWYSLLIFLYLSLIFSLFKPETPLFSLSLELLLYYWLIEGIKDIGLIDGVIYLSIDIWEISFYIFVYKFDLFYRNSNISELIGFGIEYISFLWRWFYLINFKSPTPLRQILFIFVIL